MPSKIRASGLIASVVVTALLRNHFYSLESEFDLKTSKQNTSSLNHQCKFALLSTKKMCAFSAGHYCSRFRCKSEAMRRREKKHWCLAQWLMFIFVVFSFTLNVNGEKTTLLPRSLVSNEGRGDEGVL